MATTTAKTRRLKLPYLNTGNVLLVGIVSLLAAFFVALGNLCKL